MFDTLSDRLTGVFDRLRGRGALNEGDVREAMREVRVALLEADVALPVARKFIDAVTEKAVGQAVLKSVTPGQQVVKIVHDELVEMLGGSDGFAGTPLVGHCCSAAANASCSASSARSKSPRRRMSVASTRRDSVR